MFLSFLLLLKEKKGFRAIVFSSLTAFFCGCLVLTKMVYFLFLPLICLVLFLTPIDKFIKYKGVLCIAIIFILILLPWFSFNNRVYGNPFFLTNRGGMAVRIKAERLNWTPKEILVSFIYPVSERLIQRYLPHKYRKVTPNPVDGSVSKLAYDRYDSLIRQGYSEVAADNQLRVEALNKIKGNIFKYLILSIVDFHFMLYFEGLPLSQFTDFFKRETQMAINAFFKIYSLLIVFFAVKGIFIMFHNKENTVIKIAFLLPIFYTLFIYSAIFGAPRFTFTVIPFIYILASVSIYELIKARILL
jgi:4-amino-4-deoxy-L-arabinose transferase-like glycosyltransferase